MPRNSARTTTTRKRSDPSRATPPSARRVRGGLPCPDCDFVARHAMGLGRHRSARHGTPSKRGSRRSDGRWLTRHQAAERAGVHYNTVRQWEQAGLIRTTKRVAIRGLLLNLDDLERLLVERGGYSLTSPSTEVGQAAIAALQERYDRLIADLETVLVAARRARPTVKGSGRSAQAKARPAAGARRVGDGGGPKRAGAKRPRGTATPRRRRAHR